jgi:2-polyprenyl-6-methoxyphenol hydroxylase-like FAD-dependent oxidoreductase
MTHHIRRVAVLGAGTMGAAIAAHAANAGLDVDLLDIAPLDEGEDKNAVVKAGNNRMVKARPTALMSKSVAERIRISNFEEHFYRVAEDDWVEDERGRWSQRLGHPMGRGSKYGLMTMRIGGGMGVAGIFENLQS